MDDHRPAGAVVLDMRHDPYVGKAFSIQVPRDNIAGLERIWIVRDPQRFPLSLKEGLQIWNSPVIDVGVGSGEAPPLRISAKVRPHILMHLFLQIDTRFAKGPDHDIGTRPGLGRDIAVGIIDRELILRITGRGFGLFQSALQYAANRFRRDRAQWIRRGRL